MKRLITLAFLLFGVLGISQAGDTDQPGLAAPHFTADGKLLRPQDYREWIYLSSGLGMSYADAAGDAFTNVFVKPEAYREFLKIGAWPDKTIFILEERSSSSKGSINQKGHFQDQLAGLAAEVKDEKRFPEKWAFFSFGGMDEGKLNDSSEKIPQTMCWSCHHKHGTVDNTFVQFYPTLKPVAISKGTYHEDVQK